MPKFTVFKFTNLTPLHIGTGRENYDFSADSLQSDTLSAALASIRVNCANCIDKKEKIDEFLNSFVISSAFPFIGDSFYLPKPQGKINVKVKGKEPHEYRKKLKKIKFIDSLLWQKLSKGIEIEVNDSQIQQEFLINSEGDGNEHPFKSQIVQRVSVPREEGKDAKPFFFEWKFFDPSSGLYIFVDAEPEVLKEIEELLKLLGDSGIGTDRNVGGGKFEVEKDTIDIEYPTESKSVALLSMFIPTEKDIESIDLEKSLYSLEKRNGYISGSEFVEFRHLRKKSVYMFNSGSVFFTSKILNGKIVDLRPDWNDKNMHPVYRSGKPFYLPFNIGE